MSLQQKGTSAAKKARQIRALELRSRGYSYRKVAEVTGVSVKQTFDDVGAALAELPKGDTERARREALERLDDLQNALTEKLEKQRSVTYGIRVEEDGSETEIDIDPETEKLTAAILRVEERRAKLLGLDAPVRAEVDVRNVTVKLEGAEDL